MTPRRTITICSSASFYKKVLEIENELKKLGYKVLIPKTARIMQKSNNYNDLSYRTWKKDQNFSLKKKLMDEHFRKILKSDAILVINEKKNGIEGYIGGNVLMEIAVTYMNKLPIYLWNEIDSNSPFEEEIRAMKCIFITQDLSKIRIRIRAH